jgi:hypothetical protein
LPGLVGGRRDAGVGEEAQHVVLAVAEDFEQSLAVVPPGAAALGEAGQGGGAGVAVGADQGAGDGAGDGGQAAVAGLVGGVDEFLQRPGDLGGPGGAGVGLGGAGEVTQDVRAAQLDAF